MKHKLLNKLLFLLLCILGGASSAWADKTITLDYSSFGLTTSYAEKTATVSGFGFTVNQGYKGSENCIQMNSSKGSGILYNTSAIPGLKSIKVNVSSGNKTYTITTGTSEKPTANTQTGTTGGTYNAASGDTFFQLKVSGASYFSSIVITYDDATCATPTFSPAAGTYGSTQNVEISTKTESATIHYTTNGDTPTSSSTTYSSAITVSESMTIKAIAVKDGMNNSDVATATFTIATPCATPTFSVAAGTYTSDQSVSLSCATADATIYYTTNGDTPTSSSTAYSSAITVNKSMTIKAIAVKDGMANSDVASAIYTINKPINDETFTFSTMGYSNGAAVTTIDGEACTLTFAKATGSNDPTYYDTGTGVRMYNNNTLTISSATKTIQSIEFTFDGSYTTLALVGGQPGSLSDASASKRTWTGSANSVQFTTTTINRIQVIKVTYDNRTESNLTKTGDVTLDFKDGNTDADLTDYFTSSSTGAYTYTVTDETIIENDDELISALKVGTTTVTVSQAADATYRAGEITINVTVNDSRTPCVTSLDLASAKVILKDAAGDLSATATKDGDFTGTINYTYASADEGIFYIDGTEYLGAGVGATTVTVTATPTGGNAASYSPVSAVVPVTVNGTNSISLNLTSKSVVSGADAFVIEATVPTENYNGTVTASSSNTNVATVSVDGTTVTVTPEAVGTATITVTAGTDTYYLATASENCGVTVTAPEGSDEAPSSEVTYTFDFTDNTNWNFPTNAKTGENTYTYDGKTITLNTPDEKNGYKYNTSTSALLIGKSGATLTLPAFDKPITKISTIAVSGASGRVTQNIYVGSTEVSAETTDATKNHNYAINPEYQAAGTIYTFKVTNDNNTQLSQLTVHMYQAPTETVTLNKYGYATYCSVNPMDFSSTEGYTAWRISNIDADGTITFNKITEAIKGGQGVLLFNKDADGENTSNVTVNFADGSTEFTSSENKLIGTTALTYVDAETVYGLSNNKFVKNSAAGNIPAGKAYLDASSIPAGVKAFTFVFEDEADGIVETRQATREEVEAIFNLAGQRIQKMQKGINIVNGKKILK